MSPIVFYIILSIVGFFCMVALSINAYFIKGMLDSLNQVKVQTAVLIEKSSNTESRTASLEKELESFRLRLHHVENEFGQMKTLSMFKESGMFKDSDIGV